jgi:putative ABC transport system ATP-binding protein
MNEEIILKIKGLYKTYGEKDTEVKAIDGIDLEIKKGQFVSILGASGSGKTTLLELISGLLSPTSGTIMIDGQRISNLEEPDRTIMRRENIGIVFQQFNLLSMLTGYENIVLPCKIASRKVDDAYFRDIIHSLKIEDQIKKYPSQMSGGQKQRIAIARALITHPKIVLADEQTGSLDHKNSLRTVQLLKTAKEKYQQTIIMITHNEELTKYSDRVIRVEDGKIIKDTLKNE